MALTKSCVFVALLCSSFFLTYVAATVGPQAEAECAKELGIDLKNSSSVDSAVEMLVCICKKNENMTPEDKTAIDEMAAKFKQADKMVQDKVVAVVNKCSQEIYSTKRPEKEIAKMSMDCVTKVRDVIAKKD